MRATQIDVKLDSGNKVYVDAERFESPSDFLNYVNGCTCKYEQHRDTLDDNYVTRDSWYGFRSAKKLKDDFAHSRVDPSILRNIKHDIDFNGERVKTEFFNSVVGFAPVVPLALMGVPTCMRNSRPVVVKSKILDVYVNVSASGGIDSERLKEVTTKLIEDVIALERQGYRLNVYGCWATSGLDENQYTVRRAVCVSVKLKDAGQPVDLGRVIWPFTTSGFHRGLCHGWYRRTNVVRGYMDGMGSSWCYEDNRAIRDKVVPVLFGNNAVFIGTADYLRGKSINDFRDVTV